MKVDFLWAIKIGGSDVTIKNYKFVIIRFINRYDRNLNTYTFSGAINFLQVHILLHIYHFVENIINSEF